MRSAEDSPWEVLTPYDPREGISLAVAAKRAGKSETTLRNWCVVSEEESGWSAHSRCELGVTTFSRVLDPAQLPPVNRSAW
jgi:hypothetical protein